MPQTPVVVDTNVFIDEPNILENYQNVILSIVVLKELDNLKYKDNIGYSVRTAIKNIRKFITENDDFVFDTNLDSSMTNDLNIIMTAKRHNATLITKDVSMSLLAESFNVSCNIIQDSSVEDYEPYIVDNKPNFPFETYDLEGEKLEDFKAYISDKFNVNLNPWHFYISKKDIWCYNPNKNMLECISKNSDYSKIKIEEGVVFKPKDLYQKAAIYSILNADATLITGSMGTGKSLLSVSCALATAQDKKVFILRPTLTSKRYDVGFLPGGKDEKLYQFFSGFMSALATLYGNTRTTKNKEGISYDYIKEDLSHEKFEFLSMPELHGLSIQDGDIIIVDEIQLMDVSYMSLLISRIGEGAKLVILGDLGQTVNLLKMSESGLNKLVSLLPNTAISAVDLKNVYRNKNLCELANQILK